MSATGLEVFDRTLQTTHIWLDDIMEELGWTDRAKAYHALRIVLAQVRDHLTVNLAAHLASQLPLLVRGLFYEGWQPAHVPVKARSRDEFLAGITAEFVYDPEADSRQIAAAVLKVLSRHVTAGEIAKIQQALPEAIRQLWP